MLGVRFCGTCSTAEASSQILAKAVCIDQTSPATLGRSLAKSKADAHGTLHVDHKNYLQGAEIPSQGYA